MVGVRKVNELPVLDQSLFSPLEESFSGQFRVMDSKKYQSIEEETIIAAVMTAVSKRGRWEPIPFDDFLDIFKSDPFAVAVLHMIDGPDHFREHLHKVIDGGDLELVEMNDDIFVIPLPELVGTLAQAKVGKRLTDQNITAKI
jgi:hypothetical protein